MALTDTKYALTRERRSDAISHYHGTLTSLIQDLGGEEINQRIRTFTQAVPDEVISALSVLYGIEDGAVIIHGVAGCAASALGLGFAHRAYSTNLSERDTILGGDDKLRSTIARAAKDGARAIFIVGTPVIAINNDDASSTALEAEEEFGIKAVFLNTDGFKTKTSVTGYDIVFHSLLKHFIGKENDTNSDFINILAIDEKAGDVAAVLEILRDLGIPYNLLPGFSRLQNLKRAGSARATIALNPSKTEYLALGLEESFGVPYIRTPAPIGISATERFTAEIGNAFGLQDKADEYAQGKHRELESILAGEPLAGKKVFLHSSPSELQGLAELIRDLGGGIAGFTLSEIDRGNRDGILSLEGIDGNIPAIVADGQPFETANVLSKEKADFYIASGGPVSFSTKSGTVPVSLERVGYYGYSGIGTFYHFIAKQMEGSRPKAENIFSARDFYSSSWLKKSANWFVKREVK